jgi:hypothetical protein
VALFRELFWISVKWKAGALEADNVPIPGEHFDARLVPLGLTAEQFRELLSA